MEIKKNPKADLERNRSLHVLIGFVMAVSFMYIALEWRETEVKKDDVSRDIYDDIEELINHSVYHELPPPPPPPESPPPTVTVVREILHIVDNDVETDTTSIVSYEDSDAPVIEPVIAGNERNDDVIYTNVEEYASFPGGNKSLMEFLNKTLKYPPVAAEKGIRGIVYITFIVNRDGKIVDIEIQRGVDEILNKEAIRVVQLMPLWIPGKKQGNPVRTKCTLPIRFALR